MCSAAVGAETRTDSAFPGGIRRKEATRYQSVSTEGAKEGVLQSAAFRKPDAYVPGRQVSLSR